MNIIDINEARKNKHWKDEIKGGPVVFQKRHIISKWEIENYSNNPDFEKYVKQNMIFELAKFLFESEVGLFTKEAFPEKFGGGVQCNMRLNIFVGQQTLERVKS